MIPPVNTITKRSHSLPTTTKETDTFVVVVAPTLNISICNI